MGENVGKDGVRVTVLVPEDMVKKLEEVMRKKGYATKSELIRDALREFLKRDE